MKPAAGSMRVITISREYGSGGGEIAQRLAAQLGWRLVDHEVVVRLAQDLHISEGEAEEHDEHVAGLLDNILSHLQSLDSAVGVGSGVPSTFFDVRSYQRSVQQIVAAAAQAGAVVIVGRGAQVLLQAQRDALHLRFVAPLDARVHYVMRREGLDQAAALARVKSKDHDRARMLQTIHHQDSANAHLYDLVINTGIIPLDGAVELALLALRHKAQRLASPAAELGPADAVERYRDQPADLPAPER